MIVGLLGLAGAVAALGGLVVAPDFVILPDLLGGLVCTAAENVPCRPLTLECLVTAAGGLGVAWPAISNDPPIPPDPDPDAPPYDEGSQRPQDNSRDYAPEAPPGNQPPRPPSPQDALSDPGFDQAREDCARENSDRFTTITTPSGGDSVYDTIIKSIQNKEQR